MKEIVYFDRLSKQLEKELVYGEFFLHALYAQTGWKQALAKLALFFVARLSLWSRFYGWLQARKGSRSKILPFIKKFQVNAAEFLDPISSFSSFNDFFIRKLQPSCRPIDEREAVCVLPADARYLVFPNIDEMTRFFVKGQSLSLEELLQDHSLAARYKKGSLVMARLCPVDYHRFHFPCDGIASRPSLIPGPLFSVNPIALSRNLGILSENKRMLTSIDTTHFGTLLYMEVGATSVGSIQQTYVSNTVCKKGQEKGFFSFGGSCILLLFEENTIRFAEDLLFYSQEGIEVRALMGQLLGVRA